MIKDSQNKALKEKIDGIMAEWDELMMLFEVKQLEIDKINVESYEMINSCKHSSAMLLNLINDLLDLAKQEKQTFAFNQKYFSLEQSVLTSFKTLEFMSSKKDIKMKLTIDPEERKYFHAIYGDENRYEQILINFLSNALKFSSSSSTVEVRLKASVSEMASKPQILVENIDSETLANKFTMEIIDSGQGISSEGLKHLFVDFSSLKEHKGSNAQGTGLGLSICKKFITAMGGTVSVRSEVGQGTKFTIQIPTTCQVSDKTEEELRNIDEKSRMNKMQSELFSFAQNNT